MSISPEEKAETGPDYIDLKPGESAILTMDNETVYEIDVRDRADPVGSTVKRQLPADHDSHSPEMILDRATFFTPELSHEGFPIRRIHRGKILEIIGIDRATSESVRIRTTEIESISHIHQPQLD
jgi:hypothetical protein